MSTVTLTYDDYHLRFPVSQKPNPDIQTQITSMLTRACTRLARATFASSPAGLDLYKEAILLQVAHRVTLQGRGDRQGGQGVGSATSETVGGSKTIGWAAPDQNGSYGRYNATVYGTLFLELLHEQGLTPTGPC